MTALESKNICDLTTVEDSAFRAFLAKNPSGLELVAEQYGEGKEVALKAEAGDFVKWLRTRNPQLRVALETTSPKLVLRSGDIWLPLVFLASDITLPVYLNLVASYLYDKMRGALKGERTRIHLCAEFEDKTNGKIKRFTFDGDAEALQKAIKRFDLNEFLDE